MSLRSNTETGEVVEKLPQNKARIKIKRHSACEGCGHKNFCTPFGSGHMIIEANNQLQANVGQQVEIYINLDKQGKAIFILYLLPLISLILGAVIGNDLDPFQNKDASGAVFSMGFLVLTFVGIWLYTRRSAKNKPSKVPRIIRIIE